MDALNERRVRAAIDRLEGGQHEPVGTVSVDCPNCKDAVHVRICLSSDSIRAISQRVVDESMAKLAELIAEQRA